MNNRFVIYWITWSVLSASLVYGVAISESGTSMSSIVAIILSLAPLLGLMLASGSAKAAARVNDWLRKDKNSIYYTVGGLTLLFALPGLITGKFNPYFTVIFAFLVFATFGTLKKAGHEKFTFGWHDIAIWMILWIPFDLRWYLDILPAVESISYTWWSIAISVIAILGWYGYRGADVGYRLVPNFKDLKVTLLALGMIMVFVIPPGLITGFLSFSVPDSYDIPRLTIHFVGLFLTVALPEELFFRGILLRGLEQVSAKKWIPMVVSSLAFGLMHWNNADTLSSQVTYVCLATIAGLGYGWAYKKSGNNLLAAILTHTLVDWIWKLLLAA